MKMFTKLIKAVLIGALAVCSVAGQSRDQNYPTGIETSEISGTIKARDVGDSRLTSYFYAFDGAQGDVFINVVSRNFTGDIDVFTRDTLRPLTKMVIFGDGGQQSETGRVIYLRKPERLILRVQGRTPNDEPAAFQIKFAGSFVAVKEKSEVAEPIIARTDSATVNSVGTIVAVQPKPTPSPVERVETPSLPVSKPSRTENKTAAKADPKTTLPAATPAKKPEVVVKSTVKEPTRKPAEPVRTILGGRSTAPAKTPPAKEPPAPDPLASINLKIELKAGGEILRPLNEVLRFTVDKGVLTVIMKTGAITRYSMVTEVSRVTIE